MAKKCLERAEDIFIDVTENEPAVCTNDQAPPLPARNMSNVSSSFEEYKQSNGTEQTPTVRLVVTLSWQLLSVS